ncbi:MAG: ABC transporter substrate-binding protein [Thermodesulfobacteriota bacterium]|nr:ABC transporter substrate-binding protein [Thermodesulfobacteriota bacterium]
MGKAKLGIQAVAAVFLFWAIPAVSATPLETMEGHVHQVLGVLQDPALERKTKEEKIWTMVQTMFDFPELSKRTLGRGWRKLDPNQRHTFTDLFSRLLAEVYMDRILSYKDEKVIFEKEKIKSDHYADVEGRIITETEPISMVYRVIQEKGQWRVYDVVIEGVSLIKNYRSQFNEILRNKTPDDLIELIRKKLEGS